MPESAIANVAVNQVLPLNDLADEIVILVADAVGAPPMTSHNLEYEAEVLSREKAAAEDGERPNTASPLTCPDGGGVLWELRDGDLLRYRCHVGHAYSVDSLLAEQTESLERMLWTAVRAIEEKATLSRRMAIQARTQNRPYTAEQFDNRAKAAEQTPRLVRQMIERQHSLKANEAGESFAPEDGPEQG
jgi:two-component system chemotaxis response regulator CheB